MNETIDFYCERTAAGLFNEPLNAATNLVFLIAAWLLMRHMRGSKYPKEIGVLVGLVWAIGIGSTSFHMFANHSTLWMDTTPIGLFMLLSVWSFARLVLQWKMAQSFLVVLAFITAMILVKHVPWPEWTGSSVGYYPAFITLALFGAISHWRKHACARYFFMGAGFFVLSLTSRTVDLPLCDAWPYGTHFLWHTFNGAVLYYTVRGLMAAR